MSSADGGLPERDADLSLPPLKKYKRWKEDDTAPIPTRTLQRWESNTPNNSSLNDNCSGCTSTSILIADNVTETGDDNSMSNECDSDFSSSDSSTDSDTEDLSGMHDSDDDTDNSDVVINEDNHDSDSNLDENVEDTCHDSDLSEEKSSILQYLYENSTISTDESVSMVLELYLRHKLTKACLNDILKLLQNFLPEGNQLPKTVYQLFKYVVHQLAPPLNIIKHFYCKKCFCYNNFNTEIENCSSCHALKKDFGFFFEIDVHDQIKHMFEHRNLFKKLIQVHQRDDGNITDITDGSEYIKVNSRLNRQKYDLTLVLNTDGLSLVKSSGSHCWPIMFFIAELPDYLRELYLTTIGLWYDTDSKPLMNTFLEPFVTKFQQCFKDGIVWTHPETGEEIISRIVVPLIIADAPARAQLQNILNFNGRYGCNICELKSKKCLALTGKKTIRIYKFEEATLRTGKRIKHQVLKVMNCDKSHVKGIKGNSIVSRLPLINMGTCFIPEYMHSVLLGVVRQFTNLWLEKKGPWKLKKDPIKEIDSFMLNIRPPYFFGRMPRKLTLFKHYKASEFYNWVLFYSLPALDNYLPVKFIDHWILLVKGLFSLLQKIITEENLNEAQDLFSSFVEEVETVYGDRKLTYNVHQLLHLVLCVKRWGPLWGTAAFPFESFNGYIANCVHGSKHIGQEIVNHLKEVQALQFLKSKITERNSESTVEITNFRAIGQNINNIILIPNDNQLLKDYNFDIESLKIYSQAKIFNESYTSEIYKIIKTNSHTVQIDFKNSTTVYGSIKLFFLTAEDKLFYFIIDEYVIDKTKYFVHSTKQVQIEHIIPFKKINSSLLINYNQINNMCHLIAVGNYLCKRPNMLRKIF